MTSSCPLAGHPFCKYKNDPAVALVADEASKFPQQTRAEMPDNMRVTTGHDSELAPLILK